MLSFGPYETLSRIAAGGMGEVFMARRTGTGAFEKKVALKVLLPHLAHDREFVERFFDEARLVARMNHPNIVQIFDVGETDGRPWLAMALVEAVSLSRLEQELRSHGEAMPLPMVRLIATGLLEGLAYAHALKGPKGEPLGVVHRDITPSNLLVSVEGAVLLTDFGIAKATINMHRTQPGRLRGKLSYVAPETLSADAVDRRADLFSAAVTLFQLLTGVSPFLKGTDAETMDAVKEAAPPSVQSLRGDVTPGIAAALHKALARERAARFGSAKEMREAVCDGPVATAPELGEFVRRLCGTRLTAFKPTGLTPSPGPGTSSLPDAQPEVTQPNAMPARRWVVLIGAFVGSMLVVPVGWWALKSDERAPPPAPVQPVTVAPMPEPPVPEPPPPPEPGPEADRDPDPDPGPGRPPEPKKHHARAKHPPPGASQPPAVDPLRVGFLTADAAPWAEVFLDGRALDRTPLSRFPVPSGAHTLTFKSGDGRTIERPVKIEEGQVVVVRVEFEAK